MPKPYFRKHLKVDDVPIKDLGVLNKVIEGDEEKISADDVSKIKRKEINKNLPAILKIFIGCRVMLRLIFFAVILLIKNFRRNLDVRERLVNGAFGTVTGIKKGKRGNVIGIWVQFDGKEEPNLIEKLTVTYKPSKKADYHISWSQFPLIVAYGINTHKSQSVSIDNLLAKADYAFAEGMT